MEPLNKNNSTVQINEVESNASAKYKAMVKGKKLYFIGKRLLFTKEVPWKGSTEHRGSKGMYKKEHTCAVFKAISKNHPCQSKRFYHFTTCFISHWFFLKKMWIADLPVNCGFLHNLRANRIFTLKCISSPYKYFSSLSDIKIMN